MSEYSYSQNDSDFTYSSKSSKADPNLKVQLLKILKEKGVVDKLKTQVRQNLISEMAAKESIFKIKNNKNIDRLKEIDIFEHVSLSVIAQYLKIKNLQYSLSVFIPEIGFDADKFYGVAEILRILQIDNESEFCYKLKSMLSSNDNKGFLWCLIKSVADYHVSSRKEIHIQTDQAEKFIPISEKMRKLDSQFDDRQAKGALKTQQIFEDRMISYQRELEKRLRQEMNNEIERFKTHEISILKMKDEQNISNLIKQKSKSLEEEYQNRLSALKERERLSQENVQRMLESQERENYLQRQQLIRDINNIRERELQNKKESDRIEREFQMMKDQHQMKLDDLEKRNAKLKEAEMGHDLRIQQEINNIRLSEESRFLHKWKQVEVSEAKLKEDKHYLLSEKEMNGKLKNELLLKQLLFNEMEIVSYPTLKEQNQTLKDQINELKQQLEQQRLINEQDKHKIDCLIKQKMGPNFEQQVLTNELDRVRDVFKREKNLLEEQKETLEKKVLEEIRQKRLLTDQYSQQQELLETLTRQLGEVKDISYRSRNGYTSNRSQGNMFNSARINTNRDLSPHQNSENRRKLLIPDNNVNDDCNCPNDWEDFSSDAKHRLLCLDEETEVINKTYQQFKNRLANSSSKIGEIQYNMPTDLISESFKIGLQDGRQVNLNNTADLHMSILSKNNKGFGHFKENINYSNQNILAPVSRENFENEYIDLNNSYMQRFSSDIPEMEYHEKEKSILLEENEISQHVLPDKDNMNLQDNVKYVNEEDGYEDENSNESDASEIIKLNEDWIHSQDKNIISSPLIQVTNKIVTPPLDDENPEIDPVVKQYMELVKQKRETDQLLNKDNFPSPIEANNLNNDISEDIKTESQYSADVHSDKKENSARSESDSFW